MISTSVSYLSPILALALSLQTVFPSPLPRLWLSAGSQTWSVGQQVPGEQRPVWGAVYRGGLGCGGPSCSFRVRGFGFLWCPHLLPPVVFAFPWELPSKQSLRPAGFSGVTRVTVPEPC